MGQYLGQHRLGWLLVIGFIGDVRCNNDLCPRIDRRLAVVPLDDTPLDPGIRHEPALRVGEVALGLRMGQRAGYADHAGIWGLIWDPKIRSDSSRRFIQGVIDKYQHTPTSRCYLGYTAMTQILEAVQRAGTTETGAVIKALEGHAFDGLKEGRSYFRASDHQHMQDVLVGKAYGKELGLGHYQLLATVPGDAVASPPNQSVCRWS